MARVVVDVMLKPEILDPQGQAVARALPQLGVTGVSDVRIGKRIEIELDGEADEAALERVRAFADQLLANPVIEDYVVHAPSPGRLGMTARIGVVTFPGSLDDRDALRAVRLAGAEPVASGTATATCTGSTPSCCPAASPTATTCAAARSRASPRSWRSSSRPRRTACRSSASATASRCSASPTCCPARSSATTTCTSSAATSGCASRPRPRPGPTVYAAGEEIVIPLKNGEGGYVADERTLDELEAEGRVVARYLDVNPNGSRRDIAGITNAAGNVVGLMPHPEHAVEALTGPEGHDRRPRVLHLGAPLAGREPRVSGSTPSRPRRRRPTSRSRTPSSASRPTSTTASASILGRRPTSSELAMYSVMWSEHCSYKSSKVHLRQFGDKAPPDRRAAGRHGRERRRRRHRPGLGGDLQGRVAQPPELRRALPGRGHRRRRHRARHPHDGRAPGRRHGPAALRPGRRAPTRAGCCPASSPASAATATASACRTSAARSSSTRPTSATRWSTRSASA